MQCPYCHIDPDARIPFRNELAYFVADPRHQGALRHSGVIVPMAHRPTVFALTEPEILATFRLLHLVRAWMDEEFRPQGYNIGWNSGAVAGQHVFHAHMHVIPRFADEPLAGQGIRAHLKSDANRRP
jgi:histidine triad (HIT) family protein